MSARTQLTLSVRRENLIRQIHNMQREQIKASRRAALCNTLNPPAEVYRLKQALSLYNIQYFQPEISQILTSIQRFYHDSHFCTQLKASALIEDLFHAILGELKLKPYLEAPQLTETIVSLTYDLLARTDNFLRVVQDNLNFLLFALYKYPLNNKMVQNVAGFFTYAELALSNSHWKEKCLRKRLIEEGLLMGRLMEIYILRKTYETWCGMSEFVEYRERGDTKWFQNAIRVLEICYSLLLMSSQRQEIFKIDLIKNGIIQSLKIYAQQHKLFQPTIEEEYSDSETGTESNGCAFRQTSEEIHRHYLTLILDIVVLRQQIMRESESLLLKQILEMLLQQFNRNPGVSVNVIKLVKILYEQVLLDEEDLVRLSEKHRQLSSCIEAIISNDFI